MDAVTLLFTPPKKIEVRRRGDYAGRNRCVFATEQIQKDETIETCPVIRMPWREVYEEPVQLPTISHYLFGFGREDAWGDLVALALGFGSIYNHSETPNAVYKNGKDHITFTALRDIEAGEEITIDYRKDDDSREFRPAKLSQ
jgi:SET domain-containing protein